MDSDDDDNRAQCHQPNDRPLEPHLAIFQIESHVGQITNKVWLARNVLAEAGPNRGVGRDNIRSRDSGKNDKEEIGDGVVAAEPDKRWDVLDNPDETDKRSNGFGRKVTGKEPPKESKAFAAPRIEGALPLGLWFGTFKRAPERVELEGEQEVEDRTRY